MISQEVLLRLSSKHFVVLLLLARCRYQRRLSRNLIQIGKKNFPTNAPIETAFIRRYQQSTAIIQRYSHNRNQRIRYNSEQNTIRISTQTHKNGDYINQTYFILQNDTFCQKHLFRMSSTRTLPKGHKCSTDSVINLICTKMNLSHKINKNSNKQRPS